MDTVLFPFNWFPLREGNLFTPKMGILFTFPFNWFPLREGNSVLRGMAKREEFPFNWFPLREGNRGSVRPYRGLGLDVSIQLVSPARGELDRLNRPRLPQAKSFHSIGFPCERGTTTTAASGTVKTGLVSIQLVSPARGEPQSPLQLRRNRKSVSIQLVSPARGELINLGMIGINANCFHSIGFPCERGTQNASHPAR